LVGIAAHHINKGETEMKKTEKKGKDKKKDSFKDNKEKPFKITDRVMFDALSKTVWVEEDRPNLDNMTESEISEELRESLQLLAPEDKATIEAMDHGKEIWEGICNLRKDLSDEEEVVIAPKKIKEPDRKENGGKEKKEKTRVGGVGKEKERVPRNVDEFGFTVGSKRSKFAQMLKSGPKTMSEINKAPWNDGKMKFSKTFELMVSKGFAVLKDGKMSLVAK